MYSARNPVNQFSRIGQTVVINAGAVVTDCVSRIEQLADHFRYGYIAFVGSYLTYDESGSSGGLGLFYYLTADERRAYEVRRDQFDREKTYCLFLGLPAAKFCGDRVLASWRDWFGPFHARVKARLINECVAEVLRQADEARRSEAERLERIREGAQSRVPGGLPMQPDYPGSAVGPVSDAPVLRSPSPFTPLSALSTLRTGPATDIVRGYHPAMRRWR